MLDVTFSLRGYVVEMFDEGFDDSDIIEELVKRAESNLSLRNALILVGAKQAIRTYYNDARSEAMPIRGARRVEDKTNRVAKTKAEREARQQAKENRRTLLDSYTLWGHTALRDATAEDLRTSIEKRKIQVSGNLKAIRFEEAVLAQVPEGKRCGQVLSATKIDKLWMTHYGK